MKTNVLELTGSFHQGGSERQAIQLAKLLQDSSDFSVHLATLNGEGVLRREAEELGYRDIPEFPLSSFYNANMIRQVRRFASFVKEKNIRLIHTHDFYTNIFGMLAGKFAGVPVRIASKRETAGMKTPRQISTELLAYRAAQSVTVNAFAVKDYLIELGVSSSKIDVIHNGLDVLRLTAKKDKSEADLRREFDLPVDPSIKFVTIVANLRHDVKNHKMFLRSAKRINEELPNVHFILAGEGELLESLKQFAATLNIAENTHFIGRCRNVAELLSVSYVCVLSSTFEGFSNSILEYMSAGKPVVATDVGGAKEAIIEGETGYLVESNDDQMMAARLLELLIDSPKAVEMGRLGRLRVENEFSLESQKQKTLSLYRKLLG